MRLKLQTQLVPSTEQFEPGHAVVLMLPQIKKLNEIAAGRGQSLSQMAIAWLLKDKRVTSVLIGASSVAQLENNLGALGNKKFSNSELQAIEEVLGAK